MNFSAVRQRYIQGDAPGGPLMYEMHWGELPMVGYVVMKFLDFTFVSVEKETSAHGQIGGVRPRGSSSTKVAGTCLLVLVFPFWLLFPGVWEPDLWDRGLVCFWGTFLLWLVYPNLPIAWAQVRARIT